MLLRAACEASYATSQSWKVDPCDDSIANLPRLKGKILNLQLCLVFKWSHTATRKPKVCV